MDGPARHDSIPPVADKIAPTTVGPSDPESSQHHTLKYHLLGPSLTKSGQDDVDQKKVSEIIYEASKGSKFFNNEEVKDKNLTIKINRILAKKRQLDRIDLTHDLRKADEYVQKLELSRDLTQTIVHVDCDAFYAAVEELDRPDLKDVPFAVGKGVLTTCNYHARKHGCRSGMAGYIADKLCPQLIHISPNFEKYSAKAKEIRAVLVRYDARFEAASVDEAYLNITPYCEEHNMDPDDVVQQLRAEVHEQCLVTVSAGIAANAKLAKICSNKNKPNGQFRLPSDRASIMSFMKDLPTRKVNGIGRVFERELDAIGVKTCGDIFAHRAYMSKLFGEKAFQFLMAVYLGLGRTNVQPAEEYERKSVGTESTFKEMSDPQQLRDMLRHVAEELEKDCERTQFKGRTLVLKVKLHTYEILTRQVAPPKAVHQTDDLYKYALPMLVKLEKEIPKFTLRLMGLRLTSLISMKKNNIDSFFTPKLQSVARKPFMPAGEGEWEQWPDSEFEEAARQEKQDDFDTLEKMSQEYKGEYNNTPKPSAAAHAGTIIASVPAAIPEDKGTEEQEEQEERWDCPICSQPQSADPVLFNQHIDGCLSKQVIKEIVRENASPSGSPQPEKASGLGQGKKRGRPKVADPQPKRPKSAFFSR
ncbi:putative DNA-directed polymerase kappa [Aureobasidium pullulans]|uniref:DNA polymerase kappa n=1 Tax=Aureobasidium pullulans TaxID=5580 RepID=A0AB74JIY9_AURPU|nr:putative DNA-directed polymerase kappa [Aureobasidium pullulans]THX42480.1 putative DNA-directed polymerase kappa [Aureobasidium pullulans]THX64713.1 putative DNA-directed polymerase kappa [Aureobasidium pullulans]